MSWSRHIIAYCRGARVLPPVAMYPSLQQDQHGGFFGLKAAEPDVRFLGAGFHIFQE
jgi:hypothetical protein